MNKNKMCLPKSEEEGSIDLCRKIINHSRNVCKVKIIGEEIIEYYNMVQYMGISFRLKKHWGPNVPGHWEIYNKHNKNSVVWPLYRSGSPESDLLKAGRNSRIEKSWVYGTYPALTTG